MSNPKTFQSSFSGGEQSPFMFGRVDDEKFVSGAAKMRNFISSPQGPCSNRPGFQYVASAKTGITSAPSLIPFIFSSTETFAIQVGDLYFRFHVDGGTLLAGSPAAYNGATAYVLGDLVSSGGVNYYCKAPTTGNAPPNVTYWYPMPITGEYEIPHSYLIADIPDIHYVQSNDVMTLVHPSYPAAELRRYSDTNWKLVNVAFAPTLVAPTSVLATATVAVGPTTTYVYKVCSVSDFSVDESYPSSSSSCVNNLLTTGNYNTITWVAATSAKRYNVYKQSNGLFGYIGNTDGVTFKDDNIAADISKTPPEVNNPFSSANNYPAAVTYFEQRRCFAGTNNKPQNIWMTRSGTESNLSYSIPSRDDDSISFKVAARESNHIAHLAPLNDLVALTDSAEWRIGSANSGAIIPSDISVKTQSYIGANNVQPVVVNNNLIFSAARGGHVREMAYDWRSSGYITGDLSLRAAHLFDGFSIISMAYGKSPQPIVWMVCSNGQLYGLSYIPEQNIIAWHQHDTDGLFKSVCTIPEGDEDILYAVIERTISGYVKYYIERLAPKRYATNSDAFFADSGATYYKSGTFVRVGTVMTCTIPSHGFTTGLSYSFYFSDASFGILPNGTSYVITSTGADTFTIVAPNSGATSGIVTQLVTSISGATWLEGKTVSILADGAVKPQKVVTSGAFTIDNPAAKITFGLPIQADLQSLPAVMQVDGALGQGRYKNVNKAWLRVVSSSGIFVGPDADNLTEYKQRTSEPYGSPPTPKTGVIDVMITPSWGDSGQVYIRQYDPLPLTIVSLSLEIALGG